MPRLEPLALSNAKDSGQRQIEIKETRALDIVPTHIPKRAERRILLHQNKTTKKETTRKRNPPKNAADL